MGTGVKLVLGYVGYEGNQKVWIYDLTLIFHPIIPINLFASNLQPLQRVHVFSQQLTQSDRDDASLHDEIIRQKIKD